jgi:hypothetical protein
MAAALRWRQRSPIATGYKGSEVRPGRAKRAAQVELTKIAEGGGGRFGNATRSGGGPVTDVDERPRGERGCSRELLVRRSGVGGKRGSVALDIFSKGPEAWRSGVGVLAHATRWEETRGAGWWHQAVADEGGRQ